MLPDSQTETEKIALIKASALQKYFPDGKEKRIIFDALNLEIFPSESISIIGPSGSGKSTLLHILGLLDNPTEGSLFLNGEDTKNWSTKIKAKYRASSMGFVFQKHFLLGELSLLENICLPLFKAGFNKDQTIAKGETLLDMMELTHRKNAKPNQLSGGECQRGAICRAIIHEPTVLLMDEPTGSLDADRGKEVIQQILNLINPKKMACIIVTHNLDFAKQTDKSYQLSKTKLQAC